MWSYETLGTEGHLPLSHSSWKKIDSTRGEPGPRSVKFTFNSARDRELAADHGRHAPDLQKGAMGRASTLPKRPAINDVPVGSGPMSSSDFEPGAVVTLTPQSRLLGQDLPFRRGTYANFDEIRIEFSATAPVMFEAFKAGELSAVARIQRREMGQRSTISRSDPSAATWSKSDHPAMQKPSGITGFVMNTRRDAVR